ncbi:dihydroxyacetone kinase subunit DhaL [Cellulosimicrobium composti]|uniref:dihydroxyacetone kinase subunit DhaL n=1 Tax=Cellulosimicrobium composti TaxID=2672572 RepID=UPI00046324CE|nr:dihydroxyacetone kinase subunit DhaL [Cellulosimicrobium sp. MM]KFD43593.1 dihydroxyacetone kinase [Cellulosimicrobium sp. MM]TWG82449.1 dihydroxyacetone kinase-like protein [Cellulosimicrobium cellulans J34]SMF31995.1 dihydroxyacetone kinase DhaL subunit [Cellulosimicrobium cellulans J1]
MTLDVAWADRWTRLSAERITAARDELTELDRQIGDGDHGENLDRGFRAVVAKLDGSASGEQPPAQIGDVLKLVATTLMSSVGGASGPLYGTAYLRAAKVTGLAELDAQGVVALLEGALEGITARGKAQVGEKTMVDAWQPAVDAAEAAANAGASPADVLAAAADAARAGAGATVPLVATKGRASYLGERSAGHQDPGATSTAILLEAARDAATA